MSAEHFLGIESVYVFIMFSTTYIEPGQILIITLVLLLLGVYRTSPKLSETEISLIKLNHFTFARLDTIGPWSHDPVGSGSLIRVDQKRSGHFLDQANVRGSGRFWFSDIHS
jgi:hypothetical protein